MLPFLGIGVIKPGQEISMHICLYLASTTSLVTFRIASSSDEVGLWFRVISALISDFSLFSSFLVR